MTESDYVDDARERAEAALRSKQPAAVDPGVRIAMMVMDRLTDVFDTSQRVADRIDIERRWEKADFYAAVAELIPHDPVGASRLLTARAGRYRFGPEGESIVGEVINEELGVSRPRGVPDPKH